MCWTSKSTPDVKGKWLNSPWSENPLFLQYKYCWMSVWLSALWLRPYTLKKHRVCCWKRKPITFYYFPFCQSPFSVLIFQGPFEVDRKPRFIWAVFFFVGVYDGGRIGRALLPGERWLVGETAWQCDWKRKIQPSWCVTFWRVFFSSFIVRERE